jgi:outer membrane lipoprotein-sorting protein
MKKILLIFLLINFNNVALSSIKENIINNLLNTKNLSFNFEQNINGKVETGNCVIEYPKKIYCKYDNLNGKILVSNGKSLVIKTKNGIYYRYAIKRTPLNYILDKKFLINQIQSLNKRVIDDRFINFTIFRDENEINVFFDIKNFDLIGWQTLDIYQNLNITYLSFLKKNQILKKNIFELPSLN